MTDDVDSEAVTAMESWVRAHPAFRFIARHFLRLTFLGICSFAAWTGSVLTSARDELLVMHEKVNNINTTVQNLSVDAREAFRLSTIISTRFSDLDRRVARLENDPSGSQRMKGSFGNNP